jgi:hypothetical protein
MASYDELDTLIGKLKRAAIDAYMRDGGWDVQSDKYEISSRGPDFTVTRPGADGEGGGNWESNDAFGDLFGILDRDEEFQSAFGDIRERVDNAMQPWFNLPDPAEIAPLVESMRQANRTLSLSASTGGGEATGGGSIAGYLRGIELASDAMSGETIGAFKSRFLFQLEKVVTGHHAITVVLGSALAAQEGLWKEARQTVADTVDQAANAMTAYANGGDPNWEIVLKVAGWAGKGLKAFVTGGASGILDGADVGITILQDVAKSKKADGPSSGFEGLMSSFEKALTQGNDAIKAEEQELQDNIETNMSNIQADQGSYDLAAPSILGVDDDSDLAGLIITNQGLVDEITNVYMPDLKAELDSASDHVWGGFSNAAFQRDGRVGISAFGIDDFQLYWLLTKMLKDLSWEVDNGAVTLKLAIRDIGQADTSAEDELERHADRVRAGSGWEPFA